MPRLHLKRTPEEEAAQQARKRRRKEKKGEKRARRADRDGNHPSKRKWASSDEELFHDNVKSRVEVDYDQIQAEMEEHRFREKMFDALGDDERLDSVEARFNDYAHIPDRWRSEDNKPRTGTLDGPGYIDTYLRLDPQTMDDEEYAEWVRLGMYRRTHAKEYEEQQLKETRKAERKAQEKARRAETRRLEKLAEEERNQKKVERLARKRKQAREDYEAKWKNLLDIRANEDTKELRIHDVPWPIFGFELDFTTPASRESPAIVQHLTKEAITEFLLPTPTDSAEGMKDPEIRKKVLRETILRFHPDKFEGRFMKFVLEKDKTSVLEATNQVFRCANALMVENT